MQTNHANLWKHPQWALAVLLATLGMLGPFAIDTYLPAFMAIQKDLHTTSVHMQQTLSAYLFGFAFMNLFHGAISDGLGRRPVVLAGLLVFTIASVGCMLSKSIEQLVLFRALQGFSTGAGIVISRAIVRDIYQPEHAQKVMSQITLFFGLAPAIAPIAGGYLSHWWGWRSVFLLLAFFGLFLLVINFYYLPETLAKQSRQPFHITNLLKGYSSLCLDIRFILLAFSSGVPFNGVFLYILSAPEFLGKHLQLASTQFFYFFILVIVGIMLGARLSGNMAGKIPPKQQIRYGFVIMFVTTAINLIANLMYPAHVSWALFPLALYALGWALMTPVVTILVLDLYPTRRGMASSLQAVIASIANGLVAGLIAPLVMHSTVSLAIAATAMFTIGLISWLYLNWHYREIGTSP